MSKAKYNVISRSLEDISITSRLDEVDCKSLKGLCCMEMATRLFRLMPRGELMMMHQGEDVRDALILSDEKLAWVKELSLTLF
jgi:hypothetical protein